MNRFQKQAFINGLDAELATLRGDIQCEGVDMLKLFDSSNQALQASPGDAGALLRRGKARAFLGDLDGALKDFDEAGSSAEQTMARSQCLHAMGRGMQADSAKAESLKEAGNRLFQSKEFKQAADQYTQALQHDATHFKVLNNLASCYFNLGDYSNATHFSGLAVWHSEQQRTPFLKAYVRHADSIVALKQFRHAAEAYKRGLRCLKKPPPPLNNPEAEKEKEIANGLYKQGDWAEAATHYGLAINHEGARAPTSAVLYANRSAAYLLKGLAKISDGLNDAEAAINLQPVYSMGYMRKAEFLILKEDYEAAAEVLKMAIKMCDA